MARDVQVNVRANTANAVADFEYLFDQAAKGSRQAQRIINELLGGTVEQRLVLTVDADTGQAKSELKEILTEYDKIENKVNRVNKTQEGSLTSLRQILNTLKQQRDATAKYVLDIDRTGKQVRVLNNEWVRLNREVDNTARRLREISGVNLGGLQLPNVQGLLSIGNKFTQIAAVVQAVVGSLEQLGRAIGAVVQRAGQVAQLELTFKSFGLSVDESNQLINDAKAISLTYAGSLGAIEKGYRRLTPVIVSNGGSVNEVSDIIETLTARTVALGLNTDQSNRFIEAFAQVMGKGRLQAEELNQQFSELDGSLRSQVEEYVRAVYGITDFDEAMRKGQITANIFKEALISVSQEARETLAGSIGEIQNRIDELNPRQIQEISNTLNAISLENLGNTFAETGRIFASIGVFISQFFATITSEFPNINNFLSLIGTLLGDAIYVTITAIANTIFVILAAFEALLGFIRFSVTTIIDFLSNINFVKAAVEGFVALWNSVPAPIRGVIAALANVDNVVQAANGSVKQGNDLYKESLDDIYNVERQVRQKNEAVVAGLSAEEKALFVQQQALTAQAELLEQDKNRWDIKKADLEEEIEKLKTKKDTEAEGIREAIELQKSAHDERMSQLDTELQRLKDQKDEVRQRYAEELAALDAKTPAEERLLAIRRQELQAKASNAALSEKERLEAQVSLENLDKQVKREQIKNAQKKEEATIQEQINAKEREKKTIAQENEKVLKDLNQQLKDSQKYYDDQIEAIKAEIKEQDNKFEIEKKSLKAKQDQLNATKESIGATDTLNNALKITADNTNAAANNAARLRSELEQAAKVQVPNVNRFAGGPVSGGQTYTVNELGKEAFLSASGKLSMINAPSWGQWKAPATGTIIPAHLASQLDIPKGGVNLNAIRSVNTVAGTPASINTSRSKVSSMGDRIVNNITIQSDNPVQAASDLMVNAVRQRRTRRY